MLKFKTQFNYTPLPNVEESHNYEDMTIPGESYSLKDLVKKHQMGNLPPVERKAIWQENATHSDLDLNSVNGMDIAEKQEINYQIESEINSLKQQQRNESSDEANDRQGSHTNEGNVVNQGVQETSSQASEEAHNT